MTFLCFVSATVLALNLVSQSIAAPESPPERRNALKIDLRFQGPSQRQEPP